MGIANGACLIIFTSKKLRYFDNDGEYSWSDLILAILMIENILIIFKSLLAAAIPDTPGWIEDDQFANKNRVKQIQNEIDDKTIIEMSDNKANDSERSL